MSKLYKLTCVFVFQFVPFRDFQSADGKYDQSSGARLAKEVLAELPGQLEEFMDMKKIAPRNSR